MGNMSKDNNPTKQHTFSCLLHEEHRVKHESNISYQQFPLLLCEAQMITVVNVSLGYLGKHL